MSTLSLAARLEELGAAPDDTALAERGLRGSAPPTRPGRCWCSRAADRLDPADRELLRLRFYEDQPQAEIAAALGVSQMQISRRLRRIFATLRSVIGEIDEHADLSNAA